MRRAFRGVIARRIGSPAAGQCAMPMVLNAIHCVARRAAGQLVEQQRHEDGDMDGLLRRRPLERHVCSCRAPLRGSLATSRTALRCSQVRASHGRSDDIIARRQCRKTGRRYYRLSEDSTLEAPNALRAWFCRAGFYIRGGNR